MSLAIDVDRVFAVLLVGQAKWIPVDPMHKADRSKSSFQMDSYEYIWDGGREDGKPTIMLGGGQSPPIPSTGFRFNSGSMTLAGPMTSIVAVVESEHPVLHSDGFLEWLKESLKAEIEYGPIVEEAIRTLKERREGKE